MWVMVPDQSASLKWKLQSLIVSTSCQPLNSTTGSILSLAINDYINFCHHVWLSWTPKVRLSCDPFQLINQRLEVSVSWLVSSDAKFKCGLSWFQCFPWNRSLILVIKGWFEKSHCHLMWGNHFPDFFPRQRGHLPMAPLVTRLCPTLCWMKGCS